MMKCHSCGGLVGPSGACMHCGGGRVGAHADGGMVGQQPQQQPMLGGGMPQMGPEEPDMDQYGGGEDWDQDDMDGGGQPSPLMPGDGGGLTPESMMANVANMGPQERQTLAMAMADPNVAGAIAMLLGPTFIPVLGMLAQPQQGGDAMGGGAPMGQPPPDMGMQGGEAPPEVQQPGAYAGGGMVAPRGNGAPPGVRPGGMPPMRQPMPFQPPRRMGLSGTAQGMMR